MYFNFGTNELLSVLNHRIEKYQEQLESARKTFSKVNNHEKMIQYFVTVSMLEARIDELLIIKGLIDK